MPSTPLLEAASSSKILYELSSLILKLLISLATILAQLVFPTPLGPVNNNACANFLLEIAFLSVDVIVCCPTTSSKFTGLYFRAETKKSLIFFI